jgi:hypothetical protein
MSLQTFAPAVSPFASDPFYAMGVADAYDEHQAGNSIHILKARADAMLDADPRGSIPAELYLVGYANAVIGLMNGHIAQTNAQAEVAHRWQSRQERIA